jgi:hypothetical protein
MEREVQHDPQVLEGDDDVPRQPSLPRDPYVPEPGPGRGERRAFRALAWAWIPVAILLVLLLWAILS